MNSTETKDKKTIAGEHCELLLDVGSTLLMSGAHSERIQRNVNRIANYWGYDVDIFFSFTGLILTVESKASPNIYATKHKRISHHGVNFKALNEISLLSWKTIEEDLSLNEVKQELEAIKKIPHYNRWIIILGIGFACACLCLLSNGDWKDAGITFFAAVSGMFVRQELTKYRFNIMIAIFSASFITSLIAAIDVYYKIGSSPEKALATSVLYLVPGVPLINSVIDLIEGYIPTALARGVYGGFVLLCIAAGMSLCIYLIGLNNF